MPIRQVFTLIVRCLVTLPARTVDKIRYTKEVHYADKVIDITVLIPSNFVHYQFEKYIIILRLCNNYLCNIYYSGYVIFNTIL